MNWFKAPKSLSFKISLTLAFGLIAYTLISIMLAMYFMFIPISEQAADDMAALISVSSRAWVGMDEQERLDFQQHLLANHRLFIRSEAVPMVVTPMSCRFIPKLEQALSRQIGQQILFLHGEKKDCCFWTKIQQNGQDVHIGFLDKRITPQPPKALAGILLAACLLITIITLLLVRRISRPVKKLSIAANKLGRGQFATRIPETGAKEFVSLAHSFNRMAEELAQLMSNRAVLFGGISHDLRTPITRMQIALELLEDDSNGRLITGLRSDLNEMDDLIQKALEFVKGLDKSLAVEIGVNPFIASIIADYQRKKQTIIWQPSPCADYKIEADALRRVLFNLLDNAFRYGGEGEVSLSCSCKKDNLIIRIMDQGEGIPKKQMEAVFQPFFRLDSSRSKKTGGSGLGLAIVRQLCDAHGWKVRLFAGKGKGLEVCLVIPVGGR